MIMCVHVCGCVPCTCAPVCAHVYARVHTLGSRHSLFQIVWVTQHSQGSVEISCYQEDAILTPLLVLWPGANYIIPLSLCFCLSKPGKTGPSSPGLGESGANAFNTEPFSSVSQPLNTLIAAITNLLCIQYHPWEVCLPGAFEKENHPDDAIDISYYFLPHLSIPNIFFI